MAFYRPEEQFTTLRLSSFIDPSKYDETYPKFKGKDAEIKQFVVALLHVWPEFQRDGNNRDALVLKIVAKPNPHSQPGR